jgi:hypothetical protein
MGSAYPKPRAFLADQQLEAAAWRYDGGMIAEESH